MITEHTLENSILKSIQGLPKEHITSAVGNDYSNVNNIITSDGYADNPTVAFHKALNNFSCSLGNVLGMRIFILAPLGTKASKYKAWMNEFNTLSIEYGIMLSGGDTKENAENTSPGFFVTIFGTASSFTPDKKAITSGTHIVVAGYCGVLGTNQLINKEKEYLSSRFPAMYVNEALFSSKDYSIRDIAALLSRSHANIHYTHDVSAGGIYTALWQTGKWMNKGFVIENRKISIRQETIEICEALDLNPYLIDGTGSMLIVCDKGYQLSDYLVSNGIKSSVIGEITDSKERLVRLGPDDVRTLSPVM